MPRKKPIPPPTRRGSWKGDLRFSLVSFPVVAINAQTSDSEEIHFHQLHADCHSRIRYEKVCPVHGPVDKSEIVLGYEASKGHFVEFEPAELKQLHPESDRALVVETFIDPAQLDPIYYDGRHYYLVPGNASATEPYALFVEALAHLNRYAIGAVTFSKQEHLVAIRATSDALLMSVLHRQSELRAAEHVEPPAKRNLAKKVALAETLIKSATEKRFDISGFEDEYQQRLRAAIDAKVHGQKVVAAESSPAPRVINLMDALRRSVEQTRRGSTRSGSTTKRKPATRVTRGGRQAAAKRRTKTVRQRAS